MGINVDIGNFDSVLLSLGIGILGVLFGFGGFLLGFFFDCYLEKVIRWIYFYLVVLVLGIVNS